MIMNKHWWMLLGGMATLLKDFEYTKNEDGTYTLTAWLGTFEGEPSTEIIVPDNEKIIL